MTSARHQWTFSRSTMSPGDISGLMNLIEAGKIEPTSISPSWKDRGHGE
jgi:hypothetical protein